MFFVCVNGLLAVPAFGSKILSLDSLSWWWAMYGGNVETQVCPITVAMFITSALLVACDISDGLIWNLVTFMVRDSPGWRKGTLTR